MRRRTLSGRGRGLAVALTLAAMLSPGLGVLPALATTLPPECAEAAGVVTCAYSSGDNLFTVPSSVTSVHVVAVGGHGSVSSGVTASLGGAGALVTSDLTVSSGATLHAVVGGNASGSDGGANGGGSSSNIVGIGKSGGGGGGASDIRTGEGLDTRVLIAAGGGGGGYWTGFGAPPFGGTAGQGGWPPVPGQINGAGGRAGCLSVPDGTCSVGGSPANFSTIAGNDGALGVGGAGPATGGQSGLSGGGGGGGLYGGGGGAPGVYDGFEWGNGGGGAGGSSLVPTAGSSTIDTTGVPKIEISYTDPGTPPTPFNLTGATSTGSNSMYLTFDGHPDVTQAATLASYSVPGLTLSGTPLVNGSSVVLTTSTQAAQSYTVTVTGVTRDTDAVPLTVNSATFTGTAPLPTITVFPATLPNAIVGQPYSQTFTATGDSGYSFAVLGGLPPGLTLSGDTLSGVPTGSGGSYPFTIAATGISGAVGMQSYTVLVAPGTPRASVSPTSLTFGSVRVGSTSASQTVTLSNIGTGPMTVSAASLVGSNFADFRRVADGCTGAVVPVGSNCTVSIAFSPSLRGIRTATLRFSDDASNSPQDVTLSGTGATPVSQVTPASIDFGSLAVGATSAHRTVTVTNTGDPGQDLLVTSESITGVNAPDFAIALDGCITISIHAGASCTIELTFTPGAAGARSASLSISDNGLGGPHTVSLTGTGATPTADLAVSISATPNPVKSGQKVTYTITLLNAGPSTATSILINDTLSSQSTFVSATITQGTCITPVRGASGVVSCSLASLASGASTPIQIVVTVIAKRSSITNTVTVSAATADPNLANNTASITTQAK